MSVPLSAADVLGEHVLFELECIDRVYCNAYVRKLTYPGGVASFFTHHRGATFASTCLADPISKRLCGRNAVAAMRSRTGPSSGPATCWSRNVAKASDWSPANAGFVPRSVAKLVSFSGDFSSC